MDLEEIPHGQVSKIQGAIFKTRSVEFGEFLFSWLGSPSWPPLPPSYKFIVCLVLRPGGVGKRDDPALLKPDEAENYATLAWSI